MPQALIVCLSCLNAATTALPEAWDRDPSFE
jgi:hypothetical protein